MAISTNNLIILIYNYYYIMTKNNLKWTQVELPSLHLLWKRENGEEVISSAIRTNYPKPSLCYIPSIVQQTGIEVEAIDMKIRDQDTITPYKEFEYGGGKMIASRMGVSFEKLEEKIRQSDVLGLSINPTSWSNIAKDFMKYAKNINPDLKIVIGGNEAIFRPEYYLGENLVDIAVIGEAENTIPALIEFLKGNRKIDEVRGIAYSVNGDVVRTKPAETPKMDDIPLPGLDLLKDDIPLWTTPIEYFPLPKGVTAPMGWIFLSRGCFQSCDYCTTPQKMGRFRIRSLERISEELDHFKSYGISTIHIWDDSLSSVMHTSSLGREKGRKYIIEIAGMLRKKGFAYELSQGGLVIKDLWDNKRNQPDHELIDEFFTNINVGDHFVGFYAQYFPMECLQVENPHTRYPKLMTFEKEKAVLEAVLNAGEIAPAISYSSIIGTIEDTSEGFNLATRRLQELNGLVESKGGKHLATPFIHSIFPGTRLWKRYEDRLVYGIDEFPELYQFQTAPHRTDHFSPQEITLAKKEMEKQIMSPNQVNRWNSTGRYQWDCRPHES